MYRQPTGGAIGGGAGLAATGSDIGWWVALAIALLIAGALLLHASRRGRGLPRAE
ncbi:LPXTG cell wall anchor domain-containing protein [Actinokineospora iranica]|uniref:LPXTG-motif cell wall anchor domain-containing protein n=1 Tax=Actinokineospora iranica TaxID=1271860 RepID=A0A1G6X2N1_9PSEU|nr:LPXTG cell wall anchor domain-containing protein [Actinokineospora iranica]SDD72153.1 LPXTG-motif cell wall anchor domain-containing protein [Actinokineospora iranica]